MIAARHYMWVGEVAPEPPPPYWGLCFIAEQDGSTVAMAKRGNSTTMPSANLLYSTNPADPTSWAQFTVGGEPITLAHIGDKVWIKAGAGGNTGLSKSTSAYEYFTLSGKVAASGNVMSLLDGEEQVASISSDYALASVFYNCTALTSAPTLPATTLAANCYSHMFQGCTALTSAPALPATTLALSCYSSMFQGCTNLTSVPSFPAVSLLPDVTSRSESPYGAMFRGCTALTEPPALPSEYLCPYCYYQMFYDCVSLTASPELPARVLPEGCYREMFYGCSSLASVRTWQMQDWGDETITDPTYNWLSGVPESGNFYCYAALGTNETITRGESACPEDWTVENVVFPYWGLCFTAEQDDSTVAMTRSGSAPAVSLLYSTKPADPTSWAEFTVGGEPLRLSHVGDKVWIKAGAGGNQRISNTSGTNRFSLTGKLAASGSIMGMLSDSDSQSIPSDADSCFASLFRYCTALTTAPILPATTLATRCYEYMFDGCSSLMTAPALPSIVLPNNCYVGMFRDCSSLTVAPALPATTLSSSCYTIMFYNCRALATVNVRLTDFGDYTNNWLLGVAESGTFYCPSTLGTDETITRGDSACPEDWTVINTVA